MDHGVSEEAGDIKAEVLQKLGQAKTFIQYNRLRFLQAVILILRFGQVAASGIVAIIYGYLIYEHNTHQCRNDSRDDSYCKEADPPLEKVPLQYIGMMTAVSSCFRFAAYANCSPTKVIISFLQLFFTVLIKLEAPVTSSNNCFSSARQARPRSQCDLLLLWFSDIPIFLLYLIAFNLLDKFISPTRILYGARPGTTCWSDNLSNESLPLVFRHCVLGQHGYWWSMGAM